MELKVGDKVRIREGLEVGYNKNGLYIAPEMLKYAGKTLTVDCISTVKGHFYACGWYWDLDCVVPGFPSVVITTDGTTTKATMREGKKVIWSAEAKCSPKDTFDFMTGAQLAFSRLVERWGAAKPTECKEAAKEPEEPKKEHKFKVGDRVIGNAKATSRYGVTIEGWVGTVEAVNDNSFCAKDSNGRAYWVNYDCFDLLPDEAPKPAKTVKLYCVESKDEWFTAGKVYEFSGGSVKDDDGDARPVKVAPGPYDSFAAWYKGFGAERGTFVPLVSRPAKVGEWVYVNRPVFNTGAYAESDVMRVTEIGLNDSVNAMHTDGRKGDVRGDGRGWFLYGCEYLVLDGYHPEDKPEAKPEATVREVKRAAKVGEYIKLVTSGMFSFSRMGDIVRVADIGKDGRVYVPASAFGRPTVADEHGQYSDKGWLFVASEYVVLEGYTPDEPKPHEYKPGEVVRIVGNTCGHHFPIGEKVRLTQKGTGPIWYAEYLDGHDWWAVTEWNMEPCE